MNTAPQTGGVIVEISAYQNANRCASSGDNPSCVSAGPATEIQMT